MISACDHKCRDLRGQLHSRAAQPRIAVTSL
jgi:hypothetical protein